MCVCVCVCAREPDYSEDETDIEVKGCRGVGDEDVGGTIVSGKNSSSRPWFILGRA